MSTSETITRTDLTNILNEVLPNTSVDYIVEQGTSGIWTYRKWNSGIAECWGSYHINQSYTWLTWGSVYVSDGNTFRQAYPQSLFNSAPVCNISINGTSSNAWIIGTTAGTSAYTPYTGFGRGTNASNIDITLNYHAIGKWK